jgi:phosphohistidine phosphatase
MKTLLIVRHAKALPKDPSLSDHDRPLDKVGEHDALRMGKLIKDKDIIPSSIISSTAFRAKTTAELVSKGCSYQGDIVLDHSLYQAKPKDYLAILETLSDKYSNAPYLLWQSITQVTLFYVEPHGFYYCLLDIL